MRGSGIEQWFAAPTEQRGRKETMAFTFQAHAKRHFEHYVPTSGDSLNGSLYAQRVPIGTLEWKDIANSHCIVLLGEPNIGKSREFEYQRTQLASKGACAIITRLKNWLHGENILETETELKEALDSGKEIHWFVDALDEGRLLWPEVFAGLVSLLRQKHNEKKLGGLRLRLSCRTREWKQRDQAHLAKLFAESELQHPGLVVVRMLPIDETSARALIEEKLKADVQIQRFIHTCQANNVLGLAGFPLLLATMLQQFKDSRELAVSRTELFRQASESLLNESNPLHREEVQQLAGLRDRKRIADALAAQCVLTGTLIFSLDNAYEMVSDANSGTVHASIDVLKQVLSSGLFTQRGSSEYEFIHRSFADFCAAQALSDALESNRPLRAILPAFSLQTDGIPDQMRDTASFLAGMNPRFRDWLIENDPLGACNGDTRLYPSETRARLIKVLETRFAGLNYQDQFTRFGDLAYEMPVVEARRLLAKSNATAVRTLAFGLIASCPSSEVLEPLLDVALDGNDTPTFRVYAVNILCSMAAGKYATRLKSDIALSRTNDPGDEIAGALLNGLYPEHMSLDEALALFHEPQPVRRRNSYQEFWGKAFWSHPLNSAQRQRAIQAYADLFQQFDTVVADAPAADQHRIVGGRIGGARSIFEAYCRELEAETKVPARDMSILGPWLLTASNWSKQRPIALAQLPLSAASGASQLRADVLRWAAAAAPTDRDLCPLSDIPYFREAYSIHDLDLLLQFVCDHVAEPRISAPVFSSVLDLWGRSGSEQSEQDLNRVASLSPELEKAATQFVQAWHQSEHDTHKRLEAKPDAGRKSQSRPLDSIQNEALKAGNVDRLLQDLIHPNTDIASQKFAQRLSELPTDTKNAAQTGALAAWSEFSDSSVLWSCNHSLVSDIPPGVLSAVVGFWLRCESLVTNDDLKPTPPQTELMIWMARRSVIEFERLLWGVWTHSNEVARSRLQALLEAEDQLSEATDQTLWHRLRQYFQEPSELVDFVKTFALGHLQAKSAAVRAWVYAFLLQHASPAELHGLVAPLEAAGLTGLAGNFDGPAEKPALRSLAMAWLIDDKAIGRFGPSVFSGPNHLRRADEFTTAISDITQPGRLVPMEWATTIRVESLGGLVPYLFFKGDQAQSDTISWLSIWSRHQVFSRMLESKDDAPLTLSLFAKWKNDERFGDSRSYLINEHAKLQRRFSEEAWSPMSRDAAAALMRRHGNVIRGRGDVAYFLDELIETKLLPSFNTDHSLTPLLWGKKGENEPRDEKDVQTAVYALLRTYVQLANVVGAREPEQSDGKKPDIRFDFTGGQNVSVPIEIKWSHNADVWDAIHTQLVQLYMKDADVTYGVYLVAWSGKAKPRAGYATPTSAEELQTQLREIAVNVSEATSKTISVFVIDATISPSMRERRKLMDVALAKQAAAKMPSP